VAIWFVVILLCKRGPLMLGRFWVVVVLLLLASSAHAQDGEVFSPPVASPSSSSPSSGAVSADLTPEVQQFGDWFYRCVPFRLAGRDEPVKQCEVAQIQRVKQGEDVVTVLSVAIALTASEKEGQKPDFLMTSVAPLNVLLGDGLSYSVAGKQVLETPYRNCTQVGCWAQQRMDVASLSAFRKGVEGEGHFRLVNGQRVNIKFSLKGLTAALEALEKHAGLG